MDNFRRARDSADSGVSSSHHHNAANTRANNRTTHRRGTPQRNRNASESARRFARAAPRSTSRAAKSPYARERAASPTPSPIRLGMLHEGAGRIIAGTTPRTTFAVILAAGAIVLLLAFSALSSCANRTAHDATDKQDSSAYSAQYNWDNLSTENNRYIFVANGQTLSRLGIDVSEAQGEIDWKAVAADGVDFAIVRVGYRGDSEGDVFTDANFDANIDGAIAAGLDVGVYFYSQAINTDEAQEEAERCLYEINKRKLQYPIVYDFEKTPTGQGRADSLDAKQITLNAAAFCQTIQKGGYSPMIYGNQQDLANYSSDFLDAYPIWYAEYESFPTSNYPFIMWQYTNQGSVDGININVDLDVDLSQAAGSQSPTASGQ